MQDPASSTVFEQLNPPVGMAMVQLPEQEQQLKCPRCESSNTKFCYYNNYNLSQPRHYCKSCRRYWTKGGTLRNIPVGGGSRKNPSSSSSSKRSSSSNPSINASSLSGSKRGNPDQTPDSARPARRASGPGHDPTRVPAPESGDGLSFSSLMSSGGQFGAIFDGPDRIPNGGLVEDLNSGLGLGPIWRAEDGGDDGGGGWPDLAIYTPGSTNSFH